MERNARRVRNVDNINTKVIYYNVAREEIERKRAKKFMIKRLKMTGAILATASVFLGGALYNHFNIY